VQNHYQLLALDPSASPAEIKRAFRQEIARYHPDKVQHLGQEFQAMAAGRAAQLTEAYRVLMDAGLRAEYDRLLGSTQDTTHPSPQAGPGAAPATPPVSAPIESSVAASSPISADRSAPFSFERATRDELVRKATIGRLRQALAAEFGGLDESASRGFDLSCAAKARKLFGRGGGGPRFVAKFVPRVDRAAVQEAWSMAAKAEADSETCVFLMGGAIAPTRELADTVAEQRRLAKAGDGRVVMIPVDIRDWHALMPKDAPASCQAILKRLRAASTT
jgi:curved DNA-binding protein CbpA